MGRPFRRKLNLNAATSRRRMDDIEHEIAERLAAQRKAGTSEPTSCDRVLAVLSETPKSVAVVTSELAAAELGYDVVNSALLRLVDRGLAQKVKVGRTNCFARLEATAP